MRICLVATLRSRRRFHVVAAEEGEGAGSASGLQHVLPLVPGLIETLAAGADVLEVGCGHGGALARLAAAFPDSRFRGIDASAYEIERARHEARVRRLANLRFDARDPVTLDEPRRFDLIATFAIHRQPAPAAVLARCAAALLSGGVFLMQESAGTGAAREDAARPLASFLYTALWGERAARRLLAEAGFHSVEALPLPRVQGQLLYVARTTACP